MQPGGPVYSLAIPSPIDGSKIPAQVLQLDLIP